jgi:short-subunit dehydrogenase
MKPLERVETALVTGASSGIGEEFARQLAARGKDLVLVARSQGKLQALAGALATRHGVAAQAIALDLSRPCVAETLFAETERRGLAVDFLVNNAGFGRVGEFAALSFDVEADMVRLNVNTVVELARFYVPGMCRRGRGGVVNVASNAAFQPVPYMAVYAASKAFVLHFSEALAEEVAGSGVGIVALCPGATATGFWANAGIWSNRLGMMTAPERVVAAALHAFDRGQVVVVPGLGYKVVALAASRLAPRRLVARIAGYLMNASL